MAEWAERIDQMNYFQILRVQRPTTAAGWPADDELRRLFNAFANSFHPDRYKGESPATQEHATKIFRRGNEALRVLLNPGLRARYIRHLDKGKVRLEGEEMTRRPTIEAMKSVDVAALLAEPPRPVAAMAPPPPKGAPDATEMKERPPAVAPIPPLATLVAHPVALSFARDADAAIAKGDIKKALLSAQIALGKEPGNRALQERVAALAASAKKK
jgi:curved DNA-binding protein CbpA